MIEFIVPLGILIVGLVIGVPIAYVLGVSGMAGFLILGTPMDAMLNLMANAAYHTVSQFVILTIPMFVLMAEFLNKGNLVEDIFEAAHRWTGSIRGGLAYATIVANGGMAALSGSSSATAATMSRLSVPEMEKRQYDRRLSLGTVSAAGTFASMIPPSIILIIYGVLTSTSITALFLAGIIPGILTLSGYFAVVALWNKSNPNLVGSEETSFTWREKVGSLKPVWPGALVVALVIFGLYGGVVTPSEAGALGAAGTMIISIVVGDLNYERFRQALLDTAEITAMVIIIMIGAIIFGRYLALSGAIPALIEFITSLPISPMAILLVMLFMYILMGTVIESVAILVLTLPITYPLATNLGFDPVWFGILITKTIEIGLVTPPLGMNVYITTGVTDMSPNTGFRGASRFLVADLIILLLMLAFPPVVTFIPSTL